MAKNDINIKINVDGKDASKSVVDFASGFKTVNKAIREARDQIKDYTFAINNVVAAFENLGRYSKSALDFLKDGASYTEAKESFDAYAKSLGANSNAIVSSLRKASAGTISNRNLVLTASRAMALGVTSDSEKMGKLLEIVRNRATLFGVDTTKAFDDIVTGIGRGSPIILDNLGIRIPAGFAQPQKARPKIPIKS